MAKVSDHFKITFFGDSICTGQHVAIHQGWVTRTSASLARIPVDLKKQVVVTNSSVNGRTTRQALDTIGYELQAHAPEIVIVQFGMNDCNYWATDRGLPRVSPRCFYANLLEIIERVLHFGAKKIFLNTNHPTLLDSECFAYTDLTYQDSNANYNEIIRKVAANSKVELNDVENFFIKKIVSKEVKLSELLLPSDHLHLSDKGHDLYYSFIFPQIEKAVNEIM